MPSVFLLLSRKFHCRTGSYVLRNITCLALWLRGDISQGLKQAPPGDNAPPSARALVSRVDTVPGKLSAKARAVQADIFTL